MTKKRIYWSKLWGKYMADEKRSVRDVAKMFNLSYSTVRNRAQRDHWFWDRVLLHHRAREKMRWMMGYEEAKAKIIRQTLSEEGDLEENYPTLW